MRKKLVAANWKMHGSRSSNQSVLAQIKEGMVAGSMPEVLICPPAPYYAQLHEELQGTKILLGGQNVSEHAEGAFTGEVSVAMLQDFACTHVLVGHSERRHQYGECDEVVAKKFMRAQRAGLIPILCVGEGSRDNERGEVQAALDKQLDAVFSHQKANRLGPCVISYEPLWAIGTGKVARPEVIQAVHAYIRAKLSFFDAVAASNTLIIYGGSVKPANAAPIFAMPDVDGALVGGASLDAEDFLEICRLASF